MENLQFINELWASDCESSLLVQRAYRDYAFGEDIMEYGFDKNSGYVYIALENGVTIASAFGQEVDYITNDFETGEEYFFDEYKQALNSLQ